MKRHIIYFSIFVLITLLFTFPICCNMDTAVYGPLYGTDSRGTIWQLWWSNYAFKNGLDYTFHSVVAAPYGNDVSYFPEGLFWSLIIRWLPIITNEIFAFNLVLLLSFILASVFIYLITYSITKDRLVSFVSGIIFGFCPYHFQRTWEHFSLAQIQWPAFYLFSLLRLYKTFNWKDILIFILASTLVVHLEFNYAYIMAVLTLFFFIFIFIDNFRRNLLDSSRNVKNFLIEANLCARFLLKFISVGLLGLLINFSFVWKIVQSIFVAPQLSAATADLKIRPFHYLFTQSARILSYIVPSSANPILGGLAKSLEGSIFYGRGPIEHTLYLGIIPLALSWFAWKNRFKDDKQKDSNKLFYIRLLVFISIGGAIFSMPPYLNLGIFKIYFPSFFMYKIFPMFRAYARFGLLAIIAVSILAGIGLKYILDKIKSSKKRLALVISISFLVLFEFNNIPPFRVTDITHPPAVYKWLSEQKGDFLIVEYPIGESAEGETYVEMDYLFYQRIHQKKLVNGAIPGTEAYNIIQKIIKITDSGIPVLLKELGVKYAIAHLDRYREGTDKRAVDVVGEAPDLSKSAGFKLISRFGDDEVYEVVAR